jgi:hypothetical protein
LDLDPFPQEPKENEVIRGGEGLLISSRASRTAANLSYRKQRSAAGRWSLFNKNFPNPPDLKLRAVLAGLVTSIVNSTGRQWRVSNC